MSQQKEERVIEPDGRRRDDKERVWLLRAMAGALALCAIATIVSVVIATTSLKNKASISDIQETQEQLDRESVERRDQICLQAEGAHLASVQRLERTYNYLVNLTDEERKQSFNRAILRLLPQTEDEARTDQAPAFCDEPGAKAEKLWRDSDGRQGAPPVGLPEPDPVVPDRPPGLTVPAP